MLIYKTAHLSQLMLNITTIKTSLILSSAWNCMHWIMLSLCVYYDLYVSLIQLQRRQGLFSQNFDPIVFT